MGQSLRMSYFVICHAFVIYDARVCVFQIEDIRNSIDKIDENVAEVKKLYSVILSAPTSDQSKEPLHYPLMPALFFFCRCPSLNLLTYCHKFSHFASCICLHRFVSRIELNQTEEELKKTEMFVFYLKLSQNATYCCHQS